MTHLIRTITAAGVLASLVASAWAAQLIGWRDLTIPVDPKEDPFFALGLEPRKDLEELLFLESLRKGEGEFPEAASQRIDALHAELAAAGLDGAALIEKEQALKAKIVAQRSLVRSEWDGLDIRIPGYMLPLEFDGTQVTEFLLVPYVGACIHTPPPPANQIIHVQTDTGFAALGLFTPVWVTGTLSVQSSRQSVGLSDGVSGFEVGYALQASEVVEYTQ